MEENQDPPDENTTYTGRRQTSVQAHSPTYL